MFLEVFAIHKSTAHVMMLDSKVEMVITNPVGLKPVYLLCIIVNARIIDAITPSITVILPITIRVDSSVLYTFNPLGVVFVPSLVVTQLG